MDGTDIIHIDLPQETPESPLNMQLLQYCEVEMPQRLKFASTPDVFGHILRLLQGKVMRLTK